MKVLHINTNFLGTTLHDLLVHELSSLGVQNTVYTPRREKQLKVIAASDYVVESVCFSELDRFFFCKKSKKIYADLNKRINIKDYELIHAHTLFTDGYIAYKAYKSFNIPYIVAVRNTDVNTFFKYRINLRKIGAEILRCASKIIFLSASYRDTVYNEYVSADLRDMLEKKTIIIPNGIDEFWLRNRKIKERNNNGINIVYAGVIDKNKNLSTTLKACKILKARGYCVLYTAVGRIESKKMYKELCANDFVKYIPPQPKEGLMTVYQEQDVFVMPSVHETFGLVYAEAMSQGLPVIYTRGQGFDKQFEEGVVGYAVKPFDAKGIADNIEQVISNYNEFSKRCADLSQRFNWSNISEQYMQIYDTIGEVQEI